MSNLTSMIIYVRLLDEGVDCWRPVQAHLITDNHYQIDAGQPYDEEDEKWEFPPGTHVLVRDRVMHDDKSAPVAFSQANSD